MTPSTAVDLALLDRVRFRLAERGLGPSPAAVAAALRAENGLAGDAAVLAIVEALRRESVGAGPLEDLLQLDGVSDIVVNGPQAVYVDVGRGLELTGVVFTDDGAVRRLAQRLAASAGRRLDDAAPFADVRLADGTRLHAVLAPLAHPGTCLSLRVPARRSMSLRDLESAGSMTAEAAGILRDLMRHRVAFLVSGGTGSGKTTLLSALLAEIEGRERLVIVEDSAELRPRHPHVVALEARQPNVEGQGAVTLRDLVRQALRMRPDRLIVGEVRGAEVVDMLAAMNTGHEGGCATVHANRAADLPARMEALGLTAGLSVETLHVQLVTAVRVVVHLCRDPDGSRRVHEIAVLDPVPRQGRAVVLSAVRFPATGAPVLGEGGRALERLLAGDDAR